VRQRLIRSWAYALLLVTGVALPAAGAEPIASAVPSGYVPAFVTETDEAVWSDCLWASATMYLDAASGGATVVDREALRDASGDLGPSNLGDLDRGVRELLGQPFPFSPYGGDRMRFRDLLGRLEHGGAAVILGWYSRLSEPYTRWDPGFAAKGEVGSGHAMFVTDYQPATGSMWLMDPLGRGDYHGEWIHVDEIEAFIWSDADGYVYAAATRRVTVGAIPVVPPPFHDLAFNAPKLVSGGMAGATSELAVPIVATGASIASRFPDSRVIVEFERIGSIPGTAGEVGDGGVDVGADPTGEEPIVTTRTKRLVPVAQADGLRVIVPLPDVAGEYRIVVRVVQADGKSYPRIDRPKIPEGRIVIDAAEVRLTEAPEALRRTAIRPSA
jgi:hypothetical protein